MTRAPVAAGLFYPTGPGELAGTVDALLDRAGRRRVPDLRGLVAPHAAYVYSGPVAASAFALSATATRVALLGPSHFVPLDGFAVSSAAAWATPLGLVPVASDLRDAAVARGAVVDDSAHADDHALEVELPFLQRVCGARLEIVPIAVGRASPGEVAGLIEALDTFVVVSTDLSHYLDQASAQRVDRATATAVTDRRPDLIGDRSACGVQALRGLVEHARRAGRELELLDLRTSADTGSDRAQVVGYGAFALRGVA